MTLTANRNPSDARRGGALIASLVVVALLAALAGAALSFNTAAQREVEAARSEARALQLAQAGVNETLLMLQAALTMSVAPASNVGTQATPRAMKAGSYWVDIGVSGGGDDDDDDAAPAVGDERFKVTSTGTINGSTRTVLVILRSAPGTLWDTAVFAGNDSGDPTYALELGGTGAQGDTINGSMFSGGDINIIDDATVTGAVGASGTITGAAGVEGISQPIPDIAAMDYENNNDYDVAAFFGANATWQADDAGGSAWQVPDGADGHFLRMNPDDRNANNTSTFKNDYYLEDPYETVNGDAAQDGSNPYRITLDAAEKVYYIDGNLWVHNLNTYSFQFVDQGGGDVNVTFVVKGNITFSDNLFYNNSTNDGVAFIAFEDPAVPDSGNIYFGDPAFGTLINMDGFMYAENDFYDTHLDASGSAQVTLNGNMSAGNQILVDRDWVDGMMVNQHTKLEVNFDDRLATGALTLKGLPSSPSEPGAAGVAAYGMAAWIAIP